MPNLWLKIPDLYTHSFSYTVHREGAFRRDSHQFDSPAKYQISYSNHASLSLSGIKSIQIFFSAFYITCTVLILMHILVRKNCFIIARGKRKARR